MSPFPIVQTDVQLVDSRYFSLPGHLNGSLSVTASTTFGVYPSATREECVVVARHVRSDRPRGESSRVRIDSMALSTKCPPPRGSNASSPRAAALRTLRTT